MTMNGYLQFCWDKSCVDVKVGEHCTIPWPKCNWSGACVKYCSELLINTILPELHLVGLLYIIDL